MTAIPDWYEGEWDPCWLNGIAVPGVAIVDVDLESDLDQQKANGRRKARTRDKGDKPHKVAIEITMTPAERDAFAELVPILDPGRRKGVRDPIYIENANANLWGITVITIKKIKSPTPRAGGFWVVTIDAEEWTPEPKVVKKATKKPAKKGETKWADKFLETPPSQQFGPPLPFDAAAAARSLVGLPPSQAAEQALGLPEFS